MSRCTFCEREFKSPQAVKAHLRACPDYQKSKNGTETRTQTLGPSPSNSRSIHQGALAPNEPVRPSDPFASFMEQFAHQFAGPDEATRLKQTREAVLAGLCATLVDWYRPREGVVTSEMAVAAKVALMDELGILPIEELSPTERALRAEAIRNRVLAPYFRTQKEQLAHQKEQLEQQKELRRQEALQIQREAATRARLVTRKATLMEIGVARAVKALPSRSVLARRVALFEWEVRERLDILLVGDETERQVEEAIEAAIQGPLLEWDKRLEHARLAKRHRIVNQCVTLAVPLVEAALPWVTATVIKKFREKFGMPPSPQATAAPTQADASSEKPAPSSSQAGTTPHPIRRTRPGPSTAPTVNRDENGPPSESRVPEPQERHRAAS